jgi:hypothetical protein
MSYGGEGIKAILRETQWCINASPNMYAMPVWGSTVKHYVKVARINALVAHASLAPPFAGIPQHNVDHNITDGYLDEVKTRLKELKQDLLSKKHEVALKNIKGQLNGASRSFKSILRGRGRRRGGTHSAWNKAVKGRDTQWYLPFSMASTSIAKPMAFPKNLSDSDRGWIDKIRKLISNR